ncbi:MAG: hypothetical protein K9K66_15175 [Desulfarculaceae bacterium]|nr:hypothetical protein [Desulfarculaceae bacterium]MCF8074244.1 hypothetical protein [Desulfarculaceae bacterium]MCF8102997.1 hypothetical protein [Desulfarculaceae bacterium]MCF8117128.1 hypothetical protein [Desulfarculaceae bacterium]
MRRALATLLLVFLAAGPAWAWPPQLDEFCYHSLEAAPPGWQLKESANLITAAACAPQLVCIFGDDGAFLEYRLDLDNPEEEDDQDKAKRATLDGRPVIYLQEGDWPRFTYLTVFLPAQVASLTIGVNQDYTFEEMAQLYYAFPMKNMLNSSGKKAK